MRATTVSASLTPSGASQEQRLQHGRERRKHVSRSKLGALDPAKRTFDPVAILLAATEGRLPSLLPAKYARMAASPFAFFRGAVAIMAADLSREPHTGLLVQLCGDAHVQNMGSFETPDGRVVFDINDFDETIPGPWEWDVKRMATSIVLAGGESDHNPSSCVAAAESFVRAYCLNIEALADQPVLVAARHQIHRLRKAQNISAALRQAERANPADLKKKYTESGAHGHLKFKQVQKVLWRVLGRNRKKILDSLPLYRKSLPPERLHIFDFFRPLDVCFKIVGTGSVGLRDYVVLMEGNGPEDLLFLQIKQEAASAYAPYLRHKALHQGARTADGQRKIQPISDLLLGWTTIGERDFLVRQLNDHKVSLDLEQLRGRGLIDLAGIAGELLARGHARSGDALTIKGYIGNCDKALGSIVNYASGYADLTTADFALFHKAIKEKRVKVAT